jgi:hypothetical protein
MYRDEGTFTSPTVEVARLGRLARIVHALTMVASSLRAVAR